MKKTDIEKLSIGERSELLEALQTKKAEDQKAYAATLHKVLEIIRDTGTDLDLFLSDLKSASQKSSKKGKRVSSPSPTLVNPNDTSQTCKIKGKQPEWRKALKERSDYRLWDHVKDSLRHLDEENCKINTEWLNKNKPVSQDAI
jgi:DNA-binding protein H-NS|tara:strand:- start:108 stop:539 length:432 start_codon:yes stop_codon:yes gene_type:complete